MKPSIIFKQILKLYFILLCIYLLVVYYREAEEKILTDRKYSAKWIVVTSINYPTKQIKTLSKQIGFKLIVVADLKTDPAWFYSNVTYLDINHQSKLKYKSVQNTPFNSYTRKNLGYLYAIQYGAQFIFDTDDDNEPINDLNSFFEFNRFKYELEYDSNAPYILNPFAHFGQPNIWPRGFPLVNIKDKLYNRYNLIYNKTSYIQQGLVNGDPDVDAIFRLTKSSLKNFHIEFDDSAPSVRMPINKLAPFNSQNTLFHYEAFWCLYLPHSVTFRLTDIWRSYWCQRLLWLIGGTLSYYGPNVYQLRNSHSYLADFKLETDMYLKTSHLVKFLLNWNCKYARFYSCVIDLSEKMAEKNFWDKSEVKSIKNWLKDLNAINYKEPQILKYNQSKIQKKIVKVKYTPEFQQLVDLDNYFNESDNKMKYLDNLDTLAYFEKYCAPAYKLEYDTENFRKFKKKRNITLVVTFNYDAIYENIVFLKHFYQSYFKNIVFCGKNILNLTETSNFKKFDRFTFIEYDTNWGYYHYFCMSLVVDMNLRTNGILLMSDDVLLKYWNLNSLDENNLWFFKNLSCDHELNSNKSVGIWMDTSEGRAALKGSFSYLRNASMHNTWQESQIFKAYLNRVIKKATKPNEKNEVKFCWMGADIFYVPRRLYYEFNLIVKLFRKNNVFLELAVPTILSGLDDKQEILNGTFYWTSYYDDDKYDLELHFAHPFKLTHYKNIDKRRKMCKTFVQDKIKERF